MSDSFQPHGLQHTKLSCPSLSPGICSTSCPLNQWWYLMISCSAAPFSFCPQSFPASGSFPMSWLFELGGQTIGATASAPVLLINIQGLFPSGSTSLTSLLSRRLSRVFSSSKFENVNSSALSLLYGPTLTSVLDYLKNHSLTMDFCWQSDVSAFYYVDSFGHSFPSKEQDL